MGHVDTRILNPESATRPQRLASRRRQRPGSLTPFRLNETCAAPALRKRPATSFATDNSRKLIPAHNTRTHLNANPPPIMPLTEITAVAIAQTTFYAPTVPLLVWLYARAYRQHQTRRQTAWIGQLIFAICEYQACISPHMIHTDVLRPSSSCWRCS